MVIDSVVHWDGASVEVLLVVEPGVGGEWVLTWDTFNLGGANDSDGAPETSEVLASADLDDDGVDELFVNTSAYETSHINVVKRTAGAWKPWGWGGGASC